MCCAGGDAAFQQVEDMFRMAVLFVVERLSGIEFNVRND